MAQHQGGSGPDAAAPEPSRDASWTFTDAHSIVDQQIQRAVAQGEFDNLPGAGKPIEGLGDTHDPDWWLKNLVQREQLTLLPPSLQLRHDDAVLDDLLDHQHTENDARQVLQDFNQRVLAARYTTTSGPPLITMPRDVDAELEAWRERRAAASAARRRADPAQDLKPKPRPRWWRFNRK